MIFITNTTFVNNFCQTIYATVRGISMLTITDSAFISNSCPGGPGGVLALGSYENQPDNEFYVIFT